MSAAGTERGVLDILKERGFFQQCTDEAGLAAAFAGGPVTFYIGFDPTGTSLHIGHMFPVMLAAHLVKAGHRFVAVVGGGTSMVGDPSGKDATRELLTPETIAANIAGIRPQIQHYAGEAKVVDNGDWLLGLGYISFLRDIGRHFSVNRMLSADSVRNRLEREQGLSFIEFNYVLLQAYDFLALYREEGCRLQVGGQDQWFNILMGTELIRRVEGGEAFGLTTPLMMTASGAKMGKTASGAVWLDAGRTPPLDFYQYWYNVDDRDVERILKLYTFLPLEEIATVMGGDIREAKRRLAREATAICHGAEVAAEVERTARELFSGGVSADMPSHATAFPQSVVDLLVATGLCKSKGEGRRKIQEGGISLGDVKVSDVAATVDGPTVLWFGKKKAVKIVPAQGLDQAPRQG